MNPSDPHPDLDRDDQEAVERRASTSEEFPTNIIRSTQDLTVGGTEKDPDSQTHATADREHPTPSPAEREPELSSEPTDAPTKGRSSSEQAALNQERALESGEEAPG